MTVAAVAWYGVGSNVGKVINADIDTNWTSGLQVDTVNFIEGTASLGEKVSNAIVTRQTIDTTDVTGEPFDFSAAGGNDGDHLFGWLSIFAAWDTQPNGGFGLMMVDDLATDSDGTWFVGPQAGYVGGWSSFVINPAADFDIVTAGTAVWTLAGNPAQLSGVDGFGVRWRTTVTITGNTDNGFLDAMSVGQGYRLTLGDAGSAEGTFDDFVTFEENVTAGRFGGLRQVSGILLAKSKLVIGDTGAGNTEFIDSGFTVVWEQQLLSDEASSAVAAGFYELSSEQGSGTTDVDMSSGSLAAVSPHTVTMNFAGCNSVIIDACNIDRATSITLDTACTFTNNKVTNSGLVTAGEADLSGSSFLLSTAVADDAAVLWDETLSAPEVISELDNTTFEQGTAAHHAITFGTGVDEDITLTGIEFTGFDSTADADGATLEFLATTGAITVTLSGCTVGGAAASSSNVGVDDAAGVVVTISTDVVGTFTGLQNNSEVRVYTAGTSTELAGIENSSGGTFAATIAGGTSVDYVIHNVDYEYIRVEGFAWPTLPQNIPIAQRFDRNYDNP